MTQLPERVLATLPSPPARFKFSSSEDRDARTSNRRTQGIKRAPPLRLQHDRTKKIKVMHAHIRDTALLLPARRMLERAKSAPIVATNAVGSARWVDFQPGATLRESRMAPKEGRWSSFGERWNESEGLFKAFERSLSLRDRRAKTPSPRLSKSRSLPLSSSNDAVSLRLRAFSAPPQMNEDPHDLGKSAFVDPRLIVQLRSKAYALQHGRKPLPTSLQLRKYTLWNSWQRRAGRFATSAKSEQHALAVDSSLVSQSRRDSLIEKAISGQSALTSTTTSLELDLDDEADTVLTLEDVLAPDTFAPTDFDDEDLDLIEDDEFLDDLEEGVDFRDTGKEHDSDGKGPDCITSLPLARPLSPARTRTSPLPTFTRSPPSDLSIRSTGGCCQTSPNAADILRPSSAQDVLCHS